MITPAYSPTATERVLPRMALDFTTGVLDSRVTVARLLNTATRINASGLIEIVNANLPRFDYNPITLAPRGLLIEESRANLLVRSEEFDNASWTKTNSTVTANATTSPDGTVNADKLIENTASGTHFARTTAASTNIAYTLSAYLKAGERTRAVIAMSDLSTGDASIGINLSTGATFASGLGVGSWTNISSTVVAMANGWYRVTLTATRGGAGSSTAATIYTDNGSAINYTGDGTSGIFVWGAQLEAGAFATSYIPTTTTSLTRNRDDVAMTGANFSSWYQAGSGTLQAIMTRYPVATGFPRLVSLSDNTANNEIAILNFNPSAGVGVGVTNGGATQASTFISLTGNEENMAFRFGTNDFALSLNSSAVTTDTSGTVPTVSQMLIGTGPLATSPVCSGWYKKIFFFNNKLISNELRSVSKL